MLDTATKPTQANRLIKISTNDEQTTATFTTNGELASFKVMKRELLWTGAMPSEMQPESQKGGWQHSAVVMFPVVGALNGNVCTIDGKNYSMMQHGISRDLQNHVTGKGTDSVSFLQRYKAGTEVVGSKGTSVWPFDFTLEQTFVITKGVLGYIAVITNKSDTPMPFAFGWHPAFRIEDKNETEIVPVTHLGTPVGKFSALEVERSGGNAINVGGIDIMDINVVRKDTQYSLTVNAYDIQKQTYRGLNNMQLWSPKGQELIAVEPVSALGSRNYSGELRGKPGYEMLEPFGTRNYYISLIAEVM